MSVTRSISDTLDAILPSMGESSDENSSRYKCRTCGREFELDLDTDTCPHCASRNLCPLG